MATTELHADIDRLGKTALAIKAERDKALEKLREAESLIGTDTTSMFMDEVAPEHRLTWLGDVRQLLRNNGIQPENLPGRWHTEEE